VTNIAALQQIIDHAESLVSRRQDELQSSAAALAVIVGPVATAHRLAILAQEYDDLAKTVAGRAA
jgi:hypothetical protein